MSEGLRFDDMIATVLAQPITGDGARVAVYRQLIDLVAQGRARSGDCLEHVEVRLRELKLQVPRTVRRDVADGLAGRRVPTMLFTHFGDEEPVDVARLFTTAQLDDQTWIGLLPALSTPVRNLLRGRRDLGAKLQHALAAFGPSDLVISGPAAQPAVNDAPARQPDQPDLNAPAAAISSADDRVDHLFAQPAAGQGNAVASNDVAVPLGDGIPATRADDPAVASGGAQIRELLERIESFRHRPRPALPADFGLEPEPEPEPESIVPQSEAAQPQVQQPEVAPAEPPSANRLWPEPGDFRWECDAQGRIRWVDGIAREPMIGRSIAVAAMSPGDGVDTQAAGAFARRAPFRDARLQILGGGSHCGEWRLSGVPTFDLSDGHFIGYRGTARRPQSWEIASFNATRDEESISSPSAPPPSPDSLRQLAHELRSPLNAILGFAEMIEQQLLGPAAADYRDRATKIVGEAERLLAAVDDFDTLARHEQSPNDDIVLTDVGTVITGLVDRYRPLAQDRGINLVGSIAPGLPGTTATAEAIERVVGRLFASVIGAGTAGDRLSYGVRADDNDGVRIFVSRPAALVGRTEDALLDPGTIGLSGGLEASAIGLAFGLRLVRQLARSLGGTLDIEAGLFLLQLPSRAGEKRATA